MKLQRKGEFLSTRVQYIPLGRIRPNPQQPRRSFDPEANDTRVDFRVAQRLIVTGHAPEAIVAPPGGAGGPFAWMRKNLFGSVRDSIITIVLGAILL